MKDNFRKGFDEDGWLSDDEMREKAPSISYNLKQICTLYRLSYKSMYRSLAPVKHLLWPRQQRFFSVKEVDIIFNHLGRPYIIVKKKKNGDAA